jgi:hypothetical protein
METVFSAASALRLYKEDSRSAEIKIEGVSRDGS